MVKVAILTVTIQLVIPGLLLIVCHFVTFHFWMFTLVANYIQIHSLYVFGLFYVLVPRLVISYSGVLVLSFVFSRWKLVLFKVKETLILFFRIVSLFWCFWVITGVLILIMKTASFRFELLFFNLLKNPIITVFCMLQQCQQGLYP